MTTHIIDKYLKRKELMMIDSWFSQNIIEARLKKGNHFLDSIDSFLNWDSLLQILKSVHIRDDSHLGRKSYPKEIMLRAILLQQWYNLSDVELENCLRDRLSFVRFCGLTLEGSVPDHSTICRFRNKLIDKGLHSKILLEVNRQIDENNITIKSGSVIDASLIQAHSRPRRKEYFEVEPIGDDKQADNKPLELKREESKDPDARWLKKGKRYVYGFKANVSVDVTTGIVQHIITTSANVNDTKTFPDLVERLELETGLGVLADKGYASKTNRALVRSKGLKSGIMFKRYKNDILRDIKTRFNKFVSKSRYIVEQTFGTLHNHLGFARTPYVGLTKTDYFLTMRCVAFNLKRSIRLKS